MCLLAEADAMAADLDDVPTKVAVLQARALNAFGLARQVSGYVRARASTSS